MHWSFPKSRGPPRKEHPPTEKGAACPASSDDAVVEENGDHGCRHKNDRRRDGIFCAHPDSANSVTTRATAAETSTEANDQTGQSHQGKGTRRAEYRGVFPQTETHDGAANQSGEKNNAPGLIGRRWNKKAAADTGDSRNFSAERGREQ